MEAEASVSNLVGASTPVASPATSAANGSTPGTPETSSTLTQKEILRERYLKGVKKRKCAVCGNTARARCPFRSCKTCCQKAKNVCEVHANKPKQVPNTPALDPHDPRWAAAVNAMPYGPQYVRTSYIPPAAYHATQAGVGAYRAGFVTPQSRPSPPGQAYMGQNSRPYIASPGTSEQQELQRLKNIKAAIQAANREAHISNTFRTQKMREFLDGQSASEDEAFDRYMSNMALLEDVFLPKTVPPIGLSADGELLVGEGESLAEIDEKDVSDTLMVVDGLRMRRGMDATRKEASQTRLKRAIERGLQVLKGGQQEMEEFVEEEDYLQGLGRRQDLKRFKVHTKEGKEHLKRIDLFETLLQKTGQIHSKADIDSCGEMYRQNFGRGLDVLLPHLSGKVENLLDAQVRKDTGVTATPLQPQPHEPFAAEDPQAKLNAPLAGKDTEASLETSNRGRKPSLEDRVELLPEQERNLKSKSISAVEASNCRSNVPAVADWPRLHEGFLAGRGWWKVEVDEQSAQLVCQHLLNSDQALAVL